MNPLYSAAISAFATGVRLAGLKNPKAKLMAEGHKRIWQTLEGKFKSSDQVVWIHAASLGEFEQGRPLIEMIRKERPEYKIILTFFSPSGFEVRKNYKDVDCVCYLPYDTPRNVKRFLDMVNPKISIFVKYEFWGNYLQELSKRKIPTYIISAVFRPNQLFFKKTGRAYSKLLKYFNTLFLQDEGSKALLESINITNTEVCGDTRFDRVSDICKSRKEIPLLEEFTHHSDSAHPTVIMAGSSWPEDEAVYAEWFNRNPEVKLVIAPHEFNKKRLDALKQIFKNGAVLKSEAEQDPTKLKDAQVLIIDCFGMLSSAYAYCDIAYVGGGFGAGMHNINEPAVYDIPVIYGPNHSKFIEAYEMAEAGGGFPISNADEFNSIADTLTSNISLCHEKGLQAGNYIRSKTGATRKIFNRLFRK